MDLHWAVNVFVPFVMIRSYAESSSFEGMRRVMYPSPVLASSTRLKRVMAMPTLETAPREHHVTSILLHGKLKNSRMTGDAMHNLKYHREKFGRECCYECTSHMPPLRLEACRRLQS